MIAKILQDAGTFRQQVSTLRQKALNYPDIYIEKSGGAIWASTMVRFTYNEIEFDRHHVESIVPSETYGEQDLIIRINDAAKQCQEQAVPYCFDEVVGPIRSPLTSTTPSNSTTVTNTEEK